MTATPRPRRRRSAGLSRLLPSMVLLAVLVAAGGSTTGAQSGARAPVVDLHVTNGR